jgi:hypothetical protein
MSMNCKIYLTSKKARINEKNGVVRTRDTFFSSLATYHTTKDIVENAAARSEKAAKLLLSTFTSKKPNFVARNDNDAEDDYLHPTLPLEGAPSTNTTAFSLRCVCLNA